MINLELIVHKKELKLLKILTSNTIFSLKNFVIIIVGLYCKCVFKNFGSERIKLSHLGKKLQSFEKILTQKVPDFIQTDHAQGKLQFIKNILWQKCCKLNELS